MTTSIRQNVAYMRAPFIRLVIKNSTRYSFEQHSSLRVSQPARKISSIMSSVQLANGQHMPIIGLGTWQAKPEEVEQAVLSALEAGYRHIDTAFNYNNEAAIGNALQQWIKAGKGTRDQLFIVTKLPHIGNRPADVPKFLSLSLKRLQLDYVDLYLVHMPFGFKPNETGDSPAILPNGDFCIDTGTDHLAVWKALETEVDSGKTKAIGVSNFNVRQLERLSSHARIKPANIQVELHAYLQQNELREYCKQIGVPVTAYSPLASPGAKNHFVNKYNYSPDAFPDLLHHPVVEQLSEEHGRTPAQVLLRHLVQQGVIVIPKSCNAQRIQENFQILDFELSDKAMKDLNGLDRGEDGRIMTFLFFKGVENHPEYPFKK